MLGKKSAPMPDNYQPFEDVTANLSNAADRDLANNRINQTNAFGTELWFDEQGNQHTNFQGPMAAANQNLMGQLSEATKNPFSFDQFGKMTDGSSARDQAINAAYGQAASRLDPQWQQREDQSRTRLLNQGLDPSSQAFRGEMSQLGNQRNDAYMGAMNSAIMQGQQAGDSVFQNNMASRQQSIAEALRARGMPMEELQKLQGFTGQAGYNTGGGQLDAASKAAGMYEHNVDATNDYMLQRNALINRQAADLTGAGVQVGKTAASAVGNYYGPKG